MSQLHLASLLAKVAAGDAPALRQVYTLTSAKLFGVCLRVAQDRAGAEEALQDAYVKIWRKAGYFDAACASPVAWMCAIARNAAIDWRRAHGRVPEAMADDDLALMMPQWAAEGGEIRHSLLECVARLKDAESRAVQLAFFEGLTHSELAQRLTMPLGTLKSLIRRAILNLRKCVDEPD